MKIILISGNTGSGKDTIAKYINEKVSNSYIIHNAFAVKEIAQKIFKIHPDDKSIRGRYVTDNLTKIGYASEPYFWEKISYGNFLLKNKCMNLEEVVLIIPDFRMMNTFKYYEDNSNNEIITIKLIGENNRSSKAEEVQSNFDDNLKDISFDYEVETTGNSLDDTKRNIDLILIKENLSSENYICKYAEKLVRDNINNPLHTTFIFNCKHRKINLNNDNSFVKPYICCPSDVMRDIDDGTPICFYFSDMNE